VGGPAGVQSLSKGASPSFDDALSAFQRGDLDGSRAMAENAVSAAPSANWQHLLGLICCRLGDLPVGIEHLSAAARAEPVNVGFQVMLARALVDAGRPDEVLAMPDPPPVTSGASLAMWQVRAEAAQSSGDHQAATIAWSKVAAAAPRDWKAWSNLGNAFATLRRWQEASDALQEALNLNPAEQAIRDAMVASLLQLGRSLQLQVEFDQAEAAFRRAYSIAPTDRDAVFQLGIALERANRLDELLTLLDNAARAGLGRDELAYLWAVLARREGRLEDAGELLLRASPGEEPVRWHSLRAKIADALDNADEAFAAASEMNRAAIAESVAPEDREAWQQKSDNYRAELHDLARMITPEWAARVPRLETPAAKRVSFLLGFPRSGTTLLDTFLMGHPQIEVLEEKQLVGRSADVVGGSINLAGASIERLRKARETYFGLLRHHVAADFAGLVVDKFPLDMAAAPVIDAVFPRAPMIFAQRHPCDVVLSGFMQPIGIVNFSNIAAAADYYDAMMSIWTAARETMALNVHTVVYEDLVADPEATLRPLVTFLDLDWDDRLLDHRRTAKSRGTIVTPSYDQVTEAVTTRPVGRWKRYRKQLEPVLPILLPWAERLGYSD
jgi:tetratricopeptide (TPR) repeat protein